MATSIINFYTLVISQVILEVGLVYYTVSLFEQDPSVSFPRLVRLLELSCYSRAVLSGLVISVGGLQDSLRKASMSALLEYIQVPAENRKVREHKLSTDLLWILHEYQKCDRVITPTFKVSYTRL